MFCRDIRAKLKVIVDETREQYPEFNPCLAIVQVYVIHRLYIVQICDQVAEL